MWRWREPPPAVSRRRALLRAGVAMVAGAALAAVGWWGPATVAWALAIIGLAAGLWLRPASLARLEHAVEASGRFVGRVVTHLLLGPIFVLVVVPLGLARRRHDALGRRTQRPSNWKQRENASSSLDRTF